MRKEVQRSDRSGLAEVLRSASDRELILRLERLEIDDRAPKGSVVDVLVLAMRFYDTLERGGIACALQDRVVGPHLAQLITLSESGGLPKVAEYIEAALKVVPIDALADELVVVDIVDQITSRVPDPLARLDEVFRSAREDVAALVRGHVVQHYDEIERAVAAGHTGAEERQQILVAAAEKGLAHLRDMSCMIEVAVKGPFTPEQLKALRQFAPLASENLVSIRRLLLEGPQRVGPFAVSEAREQIVPLLRSLQLDAREVPIAPDELS